MIFNVTAVHMVSLNEPLSNALGAAPSMNALLMALRTEVPRDLLESEKIRSGVRRVHVRKARCSSEYGRPVVFEPFFPKPLHMYSSTGISRHCRASRFKKNAAFFLDRLIFQPLSIYN